MMDWKKHRIKIIIVGVVLVFLIALFLFGMLDSGGDIRYIPV